MTALEKQIDASGLFQNFNVLEVFEHEVIRAIPHLEDVQLIEGITKCEEMGKTAWRMRASFAAEVARRAERLNGGRGRKDIEGRGAAAAIAFVAGKAGVEPRTIFDDLRIVTTFGEKTTDSGFSRLSRDHFRAATYAPDPLAALEDAARRVDEPGFSARQMALEIRAKREGESQGQSRTGRLYYLSDIPISQEARRAMLSLCKHRDKQPGELIEQLILDALYWHEQKGGR